MKFIYDWENGSRMIFTRVPPIPYVHKMESEYNTVETLLESGNLIKKIAFVTSQKSAKIVSSKFKSCKDDNSSSHEV